MKIRLRISTLSNSWARAVIGALACACACGAAHAASVTSFPDYTSDQDSGICTIHIKRGVTIKQWKISSQRCLLQCEQSGFTGESRKSACEFAWDLPKSIDGMWQSPAPSAAALERVASPVSLDSPPPRIRRLPRRVPIYGSEPGPGPAGGTE